MKQIVRANTFETNSSSMHSLVVTKKSRPYSQWQKNLDTYNLAFGFELFDGWEDHRYERFPFKVLSSPKEKLKYYVAHYVGFKGEMDKLELVRDFVSKHLNISKDKITLHKMVDSWDEEREEVESHGYAGLNDTGEDVFTYIEKNNIPLEEFILDPRYTVIVDGDEYQEFGKMFLKGLIDIDNIEYISSGKHFWLEDIKSFSLYYINRFINDDVYNDLMEDLEDYNNEFIKEIIIEDEDDPISQSALITFASVLECLRNLTYGRHLKITLELKNHCEKDYEPILKYINEIIDK